MRRRFFFVGLGIVALFWTALSANPFPSFAQSPLRWSPGQRIPGIADDSDPPFLVADQYRTVHAFFSQWIGSDLAVFYDQWTPTNGWTAPVDILLSPDKQQATVLDAFLDGKGMFHLIFFGGIAQGAEIYYSRAPAINAGQARAWSQPELAGDQATSPASGALAEDDKGDLFIVYSGNRDGYGIYGTQSTDGGATWSDPISIFLTRSTAESTCCVQMYLDDLGWLHAIWGVVSKSGQGRGIYYARLNVRDRQWRVPALLAGSPVGLGVNDPAITEHGGRLFAAYYDADMGGHYVMRTSTDSGQSWTDAIAPFPQHVGANGKGSFVVDSHGDLHLFWGQRIPGNPDTHGMWHSTWQADNHWSEPQPVVSGSRTSLFDPSRASAVVGQGNLILVTWRNDPGPEMEPIGVWYSYTKLDAPELPLLALPTPIATPTPVPTLAATDQHITPSPTPLLREGLTFHADSPPSSPLGSDPSISMFAAIVPVVLLLSMLVVIQMLRSSA